MQDTMTSVEVRLAGFNPDNSESIKDLEKNLSEWDYTATKSAKIAYSQPSLERLQLLKQIKYLLDNNKLIKLREKIGKQGRKEIGPSMLFDALEYRRGELIRQAVHMEGGKLQAWSSLGQSTDITKFVNEFTSYLRGRIGY